MKQLFKDSEKSINSSHQSVSFLSNITTGLSLFLSAFLLHSLDPFPSLIFSSSFLLSTQSFPLFFWSDHCFSLPPSIYTQSLEHKIPQRDAFPCQNTLALSRGRNLGGFILWSYESHARLSLFSLTPSLGHITFNFPF